MREGKREIERKVGNEVERGGGREKGREWERKKK